MEIAAQIAESQDQRALKSKNRLRYLASNANSFYLLGMAALELGKPGEAVSLMNKSLWHGQKLSAFG